VRLLKSCLQLPNKSLLCLKSWLVNSPKNNRKNASTLSMKKG
jgi:hypothetical protein